MQKDPFKDPDAFWRNFSLNEELHIAGGFIFDGLRCLDEASDLQYDDAVFGILYNLAVGIERLCKISLILDNKDDETHKIEELEKTLITHSITDLIHRVDQIHGLKLCKTHNTFINLLTEFYISYRYDRYTMSSVYRRRHESKSFLNLIAKGLNEKDGKFVDKRRISKFVGNLVKKVTMGLYASIESGATKHGLFTTEIRYGSKAFKIFLAKEFDFFPEELVWKEILIHLILSEGGELKKVLEGFEPLDFHEGDEVENLSAFESRIERGLLSERIETLYEEMGSISDRIEFLKYFGSGIYIDSESEQEEENDS